MKAILGKKVGMTQIFDPTGNAVPVTVLEVGPCPVIQRKTDEKDGYKAVQLGYEEIGEARAKKVVSGPRRGQFKKYGKPVFRYLQEVRVDNLEAFGDEVTVNIFDGIAKVDVIGTSKGKGFQGTMKRHNFGGGPRSHGSKVHRRPASTGTTQMGSLPGMRKPGQMGNARVTALGLTVVRVDAERNLLLVKGSVPGPNGRLITVRESGRK
ncbi:MAG: 50S ribosomal protein L3 [Candidatus Eremiobacteraeota bacterium]|nr:50S ribosomal protein L3 [Candidatus Eremiobacteraeota bacterium]